MRWNPFVRVRDLDALRVQVGELRALLASQTAALSTHITTTAHILATVRAEQARRAPSVEQPLTLEEQEIAEEFFQNSKLRSEIVRDFALGGPVVPSAGMLAALGRFGERTESCHFAPLPSKPFPHETFDVSKPKE